MDQFENLHHEISELETVEGTTPLGVAMLPEPLNKVLQRLIRQGAMTIEELADAMETTPEEAQHVGEHLASKGYLRVEEKEGEGGIIVTVQI